MHPFRWTRPGRSCTISGSTRSRSRCRTRSCAARRRNSRPRANATSSSTISPRGLPDDRREGTILEVNLTAVPSSGGPIRPRGSSLHPVHPPTSQDTYYRHRKRLAESGSTQTMRDRDAAGRWTAFVGRVVSIPATGPGARTVSRVVVSDVTETQGGGDPTAQRLEHRLQQAEKVESLGRMAGAISHHFNNLLAVMIGNLELVQSDRPSGVEAGWATRRCALRRAFGGTGQRHAAQLCRPGQRGAGSARPLGDHRQSLPILRAAMPSGVELESDLPSPGPTVRERRPDPAGCSRTS
jgi:hypothetical protein